MDQSIALDAILSVIAEYRNLPRHPVDQVGRCLFCYLTGDHPNPLIQVGIGVFHVECATQEVEAARRGVTDIGRFLKLAELAGVTIEKKEVPHG